MVILCSLYTPDAADMSTGREDLDAASKELRKFRIFGE